MAAGFIMKTLSYVIGMGFLSLIVEDVPPRGASLALLSRGGTSVFVGSL